MALEQSPERVSSTWTKVKILSSIDQDPSGTKDLSGPKDQPDLPGLSDPSNPTHRPRDPSGPQDLNILL